MVTSGSASWFAKDLVAVARVSSGLVEGDFAGAVCGAYPPHPPGVSPHSETPCVVRLLATQRANGSPLREKKRKPPRENVADLD